MKIAIVRGPFLNEWEMQSYESLAESHQITAFTTFSHWFSIDKIKLPIVKLWSFDCLFPRRLRSFFNRATNKLFGASFYMVGLEKNWQVLIWFIQ